MKMRSDCGTVRFPSPHLMISHHDTEGLTVTLDYVPIAWRARKE